MNEKENRMTDLSQPIEEVRVVRGTPTLADARKAVTKAEELRATILDSAEEHLRAARDSLVEGVELMTVVMVPQHPHVDRLIAQMIEQVIEFRRVKS